MRSDSVKRMVGLLSKAVPKIVAEKPATTPLFREDTAGTIDLTGYRLIAEKSLAQVIRDVKNTLRESSKHRGKIG